MISSQTVIPVDMDLSRGDGFMEGQNDYHYGIGAPRDNYTCWTSTCLHDSKSRHVSVSIPGTVSCLRISKLSFLSIRHLILFQLDHLTRCFTESARS